MRSRPRAMESLGKPLVRAVGEAYLDTVPTATTLPTLVRPAARRPFMGRWPSMVPPAVPCSRRIIQGVGATAWLCGAIHLFTAPMANWARLQEGGSFFKAMAFT